MKMRSLSFPELIILILPAGTLGDPVTPECGVEVDTCCRVPRPALQVAGRDAVGPFYRPAPCTTRQRPGGLRGTDLVTLVITVARHPVTDAHCSEV